MSASHPNLFSPPRRFSSQVEEVARRWQNNVFERQTVREIGPVASRHATSPWWVELPQDEMRAVLKPGPHALVDHFIDDYADLSDIFDARTRLHVQSGFIPAIEKIAADLALPLDLPVAPVALYDNQNAKDEICRKACLSLQPFMTDPRRLKTLVAEMPMEPLARFLEAHSAMAVYKGLFENTDPRTSNIIFEKDTYKPAYVDFSVSSLFHWAGPGGRYHDPYIADAEVFVMPVVRQTLQNIQGLPVSLIADTVDRIPDDYLSGENKRIFKEGLIYRQQNLRHLISTPDYMTKRVESGEDGARFIRQQIQRNASFNNELG